MMPKSELERRWSALQEKIERTGVDVIVATSLGNFYYITGALIFTQRHIPDRLEIACMDKKGQIFTVLCNMEMGLFKSESPIEDITMYGEFEESPIKALTELLRKKGFASKKIGIETGHLVAKYYQELERNLAQAQIVSWDGNFDEIRAIKSPYEIKLMTQAGRVTDEVIYETWKSVKYGISEKELARELELRLRKKGADKIQFITCVSGVRTTYAHATPAESPIERGALIKIDFGGIFNGYMSDIARVAFMQEVSEERKSEYMKFVELYKKIIDCLMPGTTASRVFQKTKEIYHNMGFPIGTPAHFGHSIGIIGHENPVLQPFDNTELKPGMLFALEPRAMLRANDRYHLEDLILITEKGPRVLTENKSIERPFVIA